MAKVNKQLFEESERFEDDSHLAYLASKVKLHNDRDPNLVINFEKPQHRLMLFMKLNGASNKEIAEATGYTQPWISQVTRQPFFKAKLLSLMEEAGTKGVEDLIKGAVKDAVYRIIDLSENANSEAVSLSASQELLERFLGKSITPIAETSKKTLAEESASKINAEIEALQRKLGMANSSSEVAKN